LALDISEYHTAEHLWTAFKFVQYKPHFSYEHKIILIRAP